MIKHAVSLYVTLRRAFRSLLMRYQWLDDIIGDRLRTLERASPVGRIMKTVTPEQISVHGLTLHFRPEDMSLVSTILLNNEYEPETSSKLRELLQPGMCFVDIGAHIGYFSLLGGQCVGSTGKVFAFEAVPATYDVLVQNVQSNNVGAVIMPVNKAVSDTQQKLTFVINPEHSVSNKVLADGERNPAKTSEVEAITLDTFFATLGWPAMHLMKMDVEGLELAVLRGMHELNQRNPHLRVIFEFHYETFCRLHIQPDDIFHLLQAYGFNRFQILHREGITMSFPADLPATIDLSKRFHLNILAEKLVQEDRAMQQYDEG
jgi:FkbM family methyltransferase